MSDAVMDLERMFSSGGKAAKFADHGDSITGHIVDLDLRQQRDFDSGEPVFWPDGSPKPELVITLATAESDGGDDDGQRNLYARGQMFAAIRAAVKKAGVSKPETGGTLTVTYDSDGEPRKKGYRGAKLYSAVYVAPAAVALEEAFAEPKAKGKPAAMPSDDDIESYGF